MKTLLALSIILATAGLACAHDRVCKVEFEVIGCSDGEVSDAVAAFCGCESPTTTVTTTTTSTSTSTTTLPIIDPNAQAYSGVKKCRHYGPRHMTGYRCDLVIDGQDFVAPKLRSKSGPIR